VPFAHHILPPTFPPPEGRLQERVGMHSGFSLQKGRAASFIILGCLNEGKNRNWLKGSPAPTARKQALAQGGDVSPASKRDIFPFSLNFVSL